MTGLARLIRLHPLTVHTGTLLVEIMVATAGAEEGITDGTNVLRNVLSIPIIVPTNEVKDGPLTTTVISGTTTQTGRPMDVTC